jgi:hypothetical protein
MGTPLICRFARRLALMAALVATAIVFVSSTTGAGALLDSRTVAASAAALSE